MATTRRGRIEALVDWFVEFSADKKPKTLATIGLSEQVQTRILRAAAQGQHRKAGFDLSSMILDKLEDLREKSGPAKRPRTRRKEKVSEVEEVQESRFPKNLRSKRDEKKSDTQPTAKVPIAKHATTQKTSDDASTLKSGRVAGKKRVAHRKKKPLSRRRAKQTAKRGDPINDILREALVTGILKRALDSGAPIHGIAVLRMLCEAHRDARERYQCPTISDEFLRLILENN